MPINRFKTYRICLNLHTRILRSSDFEQKRACDCLTKLIEINLSPGRRQSGCNRFFYARWSTVAKRREQASRLGFFKFRHNWFKRPVLYHFLLLDRNVLFRAERTIRMRTKCKYPNKRNIQKSKSRFQSYLNTR